MKTKLHSLFIAVALIAGVHQAIAQLPVISSFSQNGVLVCTNLQPGSVALVQWASSLSGPWNTNWAALTAVTADTNGTITVSVPMFYRVLGQTNSGGQFTSDGMALIPAGTFTMGDITDTNEKGDAAPTNVTVSAFYMDTNLVSWSQWQTVYAYATNHGYGFDHAGSGKAANHPVQTIDWYDMVKWCNARSEQAGLVPAYYTSAAQTTVYRTGWTDVQTNWVKWSSGYRLPTEAEWEKAARGGLSGQRFPWGNTISESQANYNGDTSYSYDLGPNGYNANFYTFPNYPYTSPVGYFAANGYGLYDMAGNVYEWCWDWYGTPYAGGSDPCGPASGSVRVLRGGVWINVARVARCANRGVNSPDSAGDNVGFRCVRGL